MANDEVVLMDFWVSPFGMRARIALAEKGIRYAYKEENLADKSPLLLKMNPVYKKIPVLIHNGKPICESLIMVQYIDEVWHDKSPLLPSDPYQRAQARYIYDCGRRVYMNKGDDQEKAKVELIECLKVLESELGDKPYFGDEKLGFVDIVFVPFYAWFHTYKTFGKFSVEKECPKLMAWVKRCMEKESVWKTIPDLQKVYDFSLVLREKFGG
ncbi:hypothetical protein MKX01_005431 [Papaver californicum]|nr:hypothetical protein MKX01_005431 [Papaver californicum]